MNQQNSMKMKKALRITKQVKKKQSLIKTYSSQASSMQNWITKPDPVKYGEKELQTDPWLLN